MAGGGYKKIPVAPPLQALDVKGTVIVEQPTASYLYKYAPVRECLLAQDFRSASFRMVGFGHSSWEADGPPDPCVWQLQLGVRFRGRRERQGKGRPGGQGRRLP